MNQTGYFPLLGCCMLEQIGIHRVSTTWAPRHAHLVFLEQFWRVLRLYWWDCFMRVCSSSSRIEIQRAGELRCDCGTFFFFFLCNRSKAGGMRLSSRTMKIIQGQDGQLRTRRSAHLGNTQPIPFVCAHPGLGWLVICDPLLLQLPAAFVLITFTRTITSPACGSVLGQWEIAIHCFAVHVLSFEFTINDAKSGNKGCDLKAFLLIARSLTRFHHSRQLVLCVECETYPYRSQYALQELTI